MEFLLFLILVPILLPIFFVLRFIIEPVFNFILYGGERNDMDSVLSKHHPSPRTYRSSATDAGFMGWVDGIIDTILPSSGPTTATAVGGDNKAYKRENSNLRKQIQVMEREIARLEQVESSLYEQVRDARQSAAAASTASAGGDKELRQHLQTMGDEVERLTQVEQQLNREVTRLQGEVAEARQNAGSGAPAPDLDKSALLESDVAEKREDIINEINIQMNPTINTDSKGKGDDKLRSDSGIILRKIDAQLRDELDKIGKVFVGLSTRQLTFSDQELKSFLTGTYFRIMGSAVQQRRKR